MALVTRANYKTRAGIAVTTFDSVIDLLIAEAEQKIANYCDRVLEDAGSDITEYYDGTGSEVLYLNAYPVASVTSVSYLSSVSSGVPSYTVYAGTDYYFNPNTGELIRYASEDYAFGDSDTPFACWPSGHKNLKVVYQGGYTSSTVPGDLSSTIYDLIAMLLAARNGTLEQPTEQDIKAFLDERIPHYRRMRL